MNSDTPHTVGEDESRKPLQRRLPIRLGLSAAILAGAFGGPLPAAVAEDGDGPSYDEQEVPDGQSVDEQGEEGGPNDDSDPGEKGDEPEAPPTPPAHAPAPAPAPPATPPTPPAPAPTPAPGPQPPAVQTPGPAAAPPQPAPSTVAVPTEPRTERRAAQPRRRNAREPRAQRPAAAQTSQPQVVQAPPPPAAPQRERAVAERAPARSNPPAPSGRTHVVGQGETLWSIAQRMLGKGASSAQVARMVDRLWDLNRSVIGTGSPDLLKVGTDLRLPRQ